VSYPIANHSEIRALPSEFGVVLEARQYRHREGPGKAFYLRAKRLLDFALSLAALVVLSPILFVVSLLIKLEDGGPVFFQQTRVGKGGRQFKFWKFRSMCLDAEAKKLELESDQDSVRFKMAQDPRITRTGRIIRRFSLDELPQFVNVLRGDMSLVGPRPPIPAEVAEYTPYEMRRLAVEQGLTCTWQVSGRSLIPFEQQVKMDLEYAETRTLWVDASLLLRTVPAMLGGRGAY